MAASTECFALPIADAMRCSHASCGQKNAWAFRVAVCTLSESSAEGVEAHPCSRKAKTINIVN